MSGVEIEFRSIEEDDASEQPEGEGSDTSTEHERPQEGGTRPSPWTRIQGGWGVIEFPLNALWLTSGAGPSQIMQLIGHAGLRQLLAQHRTTRNAVDDEDDDDIEYGFGNLGRRRRRKTKDGKVEFPKVPSEEGQRLMDTGVFGTSQYYRDRQSKRKTKLPRKLLSREMGNDRSQTTRSTAAIVQVN